MTENGSVYDGFISYSHAADDLLAPRLQAALQRFAKAWWKRRAVRIFRDESSLSANPHLWSSITEALDRSGWFVLLLSPDAADSEWVNQEIEYWTTHRDPDRILPVVTDGDFGWHDGNVEGDAVPHALEGVFTEEPRWVDLRWAKGETQLDLKNPRFADAIADIASTIRGVPKDDLASEEVKQHRRTVRTAWTAGAALIALTVVAIGASIQSSRNAAEAQASALLASARTVVDDDVDLALLLSLEAARLLPSDSAPVEEVLHNILVAGTPVRSLEVPADALARSYAVAVRPGMAQIAATASGNWVGLFDIASGDLIGEFGTTNTTFSSSVPSIAFDAQGDRLAAIGTTGVARVWDLSSGEVVVEIDTGEGDTGTVVFAANDQVLITSIHSRTAWDLRTGDALWRNSDQVQTFGGAPVSVDHRDQLVAWPSITNNVVTAADVQTGEVAWHIPLSAAVAVDFHPNLDVILVKSQFLGAQMHDYSTGSPEMVYSVRVQAPTDAVFDPTGERFAVGGLIGQGGTSTGVFAATNPADPGAGWTQIATVRTGTPLPLSLAFLPGTSDLAAGQPRNAGIWSTEPVGEVARMQLSSPAWTIDAVPDTDLVISSHPPNFGRNALVVQDVSTQEIVFVSEGEFDPTSWVVARSTSQSTAVVALPGEQDLAIIDPRSGNTLTTLQRVDDVPYSPNVVDISADASLVAAGHLDSPLITVWDGSTGQVAHQFEVRELGTIQAIRLSPDHSVIGIGGDDGVAVVEINQAGVTTPVLLPAEGNNHGIAFSPDGGTLASVDDTFGLLNVFDLASSTRTIAIPVSGAFDPEFTEDGTQLILAGAQSGVIAFDTSTWTRRWTIPTESLPNAVLTLDVDGNRLVFQDVTGVLHELTLDYNELVGIAAARLNRGLSDQECATYRIDPCPTLAEIQSR